MAVPISRSLIRKSNTVEYSSTLSLNIIALINAAEKKENKNPTRQGLFTMIIFMNTHAMTSTEISMTTHDKGMTAADIQSLTAVSINMSLFDNIISFTDLGQLIINGETLVFEQKLNFELIFQELLKAKQLFKTLNPDDFSDLIKLSGVL
jgi:hypothetical protein